VDDSFANSQRHRDANRVPEVVTIALIVAAAENGVIGRGGRLPWRMPSDLKTFRRLTLGKPVVMGRRTLQSIGRALDGRDNIVVTRNAAFTAPGIEVAPTLEAALALARGHAARRGAAEIMVIGGAEIYRAALPQAGRIYLTRVHAHPDGDATFPDLPAEDWPVVRKEPIPPDPRDEHAATLFVHERRPPPPVG
jgi:dihydrofolate reductase